jgi:hypothetical protein
VLEQQDSKTAWTHQLQWLSEASLHRVDFAYSHLRGITVDASATEFGGFTLQGLR